MVHFNIKILMIKQKSMVNSKDNLVECPSLLGTVPALTTFSRGAAPNTLNTGLGLEGETHRTMACCPTLVVYSSSVALSFLHTNTQLYNPQITR